MGHWAESYLGRPWSPEANCAALVREVLAREFGVEVALPVADEDPRRWRWQIARHRDRLADPVAGAPREGDGVLMRGVGRSGMGTHIGVWCAPNGRAHVLHALQGIGGCLTLLAVLPSRGLEVVGVYRWRA